jgi:multiple sugar transport system substrate-binding protein
MALVVAACGSDNGGGGGGGGGGGSAGGGSGGTNTTQGAKTIDVNAMNGAKGSVTYCTGKDTSGAQIKSVKDFNAKFKSQGLSAKLLEFPESADEQRNQFIQRQRAKSGECDIFYSDVIWTAEFAAQKWLYDVSPYVKSRANEFVPSTLKTINFENKYWGVPKQTDAALLYYRTDKIKSAPKTWQEVYQQGKATGGSTGGYIYAGAPYEGTTCTFLEMAFAAGGQVLNADGTKAVINSPQNVKALQFMVDGIKSGAVPKAIVTYMEEPARRAFEAGKASIERQWPYAYALGKKSAIANKFAVAPLPTWEGGKRGGVLGGHNLVISAYSQNPGGALKLIDFLTKPQIERQDAAKYSLAPVLKETWQDPAVKKALPFSDELLQSVQSAGVRPVTAVYPQVSQAIYNNVNAALRGTVSPQDALKKAQSDIDKALATF